MLLIPTLPPERIVIFSEEFVANLNDWASLSHNPPVPDESRNTVIPSLAPTPWLVDVKCKSVCPEEFNCKSLVGLIVPIPTLTPELVP